MKRDVGALTSREFDLLVIGGGIFGACAAWDAALRGLSVALVEKDDFAAGASANCFKMVHGGIRYLQHADFGRLRSSCFERSAFLRVAPHLVHPLPIVIPTYGHFRQGKEFLGTGMRLFDFLTLDRNKGITDSARHIPNSEFLNRKQLLDLFPDVDDKGLTGGAAFRDGQMYNPNRLILAFVQSASDAGATVANHVEVTGLAQRNQTITGAIVKDTIDGNEFEIRAKVTLNATGPWAEDLLRSSSHQSVVDQGTYSRDACFVIPRRFDHQYGLAVQGRTKDPGAVISREARHLFIVPWRDHTLIGVWHIVWRDGPDAVKIRADELENFIDEINWAYPTLQLRPDQVTMWNAGLVPFGENESGAVDLRYGKESRIIDHRKETNQDGLITLIGIRYTMGRADAAHAVNLACAKLDRNLAPAPTATTPIRGGDIADFEQLVSRVHQEQTFSLPKGAVDTLCHNHGTEYRSLFELMSKDPSLASPVGGSRVLRAEIVHAVRAEMALSLADIVFRRTDLATGANPGDDALEACAALAASELGWTPQQVETELDSVRSRLTIPRANV